MTAIGVLSRGMTAAELRDYLDADADLAPLSSKLRANVDVNLLLELVKVAMSFSAPIEPAIMPYFEEADFALCGKLALRLNSLNEVGVASSAAAQKKGHVLFAKLRAAQELERQAAVSARSMAQLLQANQATATADQREKDLDAKRRFEENGCEYTRHFFFIHNLDVAAAVSPAGKCSYEEPVEKVNGALARRSRGSMVNYKAESADLS